MLETQIPTLEKPSDVKRVLFLVSWVWGFLWLTAFQNIVLTPEHRVGLYGSLEGAVDGVAEMAPFAVIAALFCAYFGTSVFELHSTVYDHIFVRWRVRHEADFILPRLFGPFRNHLAPDYAEGLKTHTKKLISRVFCPFITGKQYQLDPGLIRRFYRSLAWYWITQINEMAIIAWIVFTFSYAWWGRATGDVPVGWQASLLFQLTWVLSIGAINNLLLVRAARKAVRARTQDEIDEIVHIYRAELETLTIEAAQHFGFIDDRAFPEQHVATVYPRVSKGSSLHEESEDQAFLASPMAAFAPAGYIDDRKLMMELVHCLKAECGFKHVFYAGETLLDQTKFEDTFVALSKDLREIRRSSVFILHYPERLPSSALFEFGFALALGKPVVILIRQKTDLPFLLQATSQLESVTEFTYKNNEDLISVVTSAKEAFLRRGISQRRTWLGKLG